MKIVAASNGARNLQISRAEWLRIGRHAGWIKSAQPDPRTVVVDPSQVRPIIDSMGNRRFMVGYRKKDGSYRVMHAQRRVDKYTTEESDPTHAETREQYGLILVYDLDVARRIVNDLRYNPDEDQEDRRRIREKALRRAYRSIYPENVEMIRGRGRTWLVETAENPDIQRMIGEVSAQHIEPLAE